MHDRPRITFPVDFGSRQNPSGRNCNLAPTETEMGITEFVTGQF